MRHMSLRNIPGWKRVTSQWPIFCAWIILIGWSSLLQNPIYRWFVIFLHAYLIAVIASTNKVIKGVLYSIIFLLFFIDEFLILGFGMTINPTTLTLFLETDQRESKEFLSGVFSMSSFWVTSFLTIGFAAIVLIMERHRTKIFERLSRKKWLQYFSVLMLVIGLLGSWGYVELFKVKSPDDLWFKWQQYRRNPQDRMTKVIASIYSIHLANKALEDNLELMSQVDGVSIKDGYKGVNVIFVIGESYIRQHSPLYGYRLNTTPYMLQESKDGRLFAFDNVTTPYSFTTTSVRNMISCNAFGAGEKWSDKPPFTVVFKKAGYNVHMYDNQRQSIKDAVYIFTLNNYLFDKRVVSMCYNSINERTFKYDSDIVDYYKQCESGKNEQNRLVVFHLMGQHFTYRERYPDEFNHFNGDSIYWRNDNWLTKEKRQVIAEYDNAVMYNDYVIHQIMDLYNDEKTVLVYLPDHGEEAFDYRDFSGRSENMDNIAKMLEYQYSIPMVVWCSDAYKEAYPDNIAKIQSAIHKPMMNYDVCHLLFHLGGVSSQYYKSQHDVISDDYKCLPRIMNDKYDYDKYVVKGK